MLSLTAFGFFWCGTLPFGMDLIIAVDETRTTAPLQFPLQYIGLSAGAFLASFFVGVSVKGAFYVSIILFVVTIVCYAMVFWLRARTVGSGTPDHELASLV